MSTDQLSRRQATDFWINKISGAQSCHFPGPENNGDQKSDDGIIRIPIATEAWQKLQESVHHKPINTFKIFLSGLQIVTWRYFGQTDLLVTTPAFRLDESMPLLQDPLFFRVDMTSGSTARDQLKAVHQGVLEALRYREYDDLRLKEKLNGTLGSIRSLGFAYQSFNEGLSAQGLADLQFTLIDDPEPILEIRFQTDRHDRNMLTRFGNHLIRVAGSIASDPDQKISKVQLLSEQEQLDLTYKYSGQEVEIPDQSIIELFEARVQATPHQTAVTFRGQQLSYQQLNRRVNQVANYLLEKRNGEEEPVIGVCLPASDELVIAVVGIIKSGAAYLPIDPNYPEDRISAILSSGLTSLVISKDEIPASEIITEQVDLATINSILEQGSVDNPEVKIYPDQLIYVNFTSGTTSLPKGIMVEHRGFSNLINWYDQLFDFSQIRNVIQITNIIIDIALQEVFTSLTNGLNLVIPEREVILDKSRMTAFIEDHEINFIQLIPATLSEYLLDHPKIPCLEVVLCGGDKLGAALQDAIVAKGYNLYNIYGQTETTVDAVFARSEVGRYSFELKVNNYHIYLLDKEHQHCPYGVTGEICIGGVGVSRGYVNMPELTEEKFINDPFRPGHKLYKTGDLGRRLENGELEIVGRDDTQVKIRGFRVEMIEIERALLTHRWIQEAVVVAKGDGDRYLVAYYVAQETVQEEDLRTQILDRLPDYMVPRYFIQLEQLPLTEANKVDKKSLPDPGSFLTDRLKGTQKPQTTYEIKLHEIWVDLLERQDFGIHDNFFVLGGDSIKIIRLLAQINEAFKTNLEVQHVLERQSIKELCDWIEEKKQESSQDCYELTNAEWLASYLNFEGKWMSYSILLDEEISPQKVPDMFTALSRVFEVLALRHTPETNTWYIDHVGLKDQLQAGESTEFFLKVNQPSPNEILVALHPIVADQLPLSAFINALLSYLKGTEISEEFRSFAAHLQEMRELSGSSDYWLSYVQGLNTRDIEPASEGQEIPLQAYTLIEDFQKVRASLRDNNLNVQWEHLLITSLMSSIRELETDLSHLLFQISHHSRFYKEVIYPTYNIPLNIRRSQDLSALIEIKDEINCCRNEAFDWDQLTHYSLGDSKALKVSLSDCFGLEGLNDFRISQVDGRCNSQVHLTINKQGDLDLYFAGSSLLLAEIKGKFDKHCRALLQSVLNTRTRKYSISDFPLAPLKKEDLVLLPEDTVDVYPLYDIQYGMLFHTLHDKEKAIYRNQMVYPLKVDFERFKETLILWLKHCDMLRTSIVRTFKGEYVQVVRKDWKFDFEVEDISDLPDVEKEKRIKTYLDKDRTGGITFRHEMMHHGKFFKTALGDYFFIWTQHHFVEDGWSGSRMHVELARIYTRLGEGEKIDALPPLATSYRDFVAEQLNPLKWKQHREFWTDYMKDYPVLKLPDNIYELDYEPAKTIHRWMPDDLLDKIVQFNEAHDISFKAIFMGAYVYLMHLFTGKKEISFGTVGHGRPTRPDAEKIFGCFLNTVPIKFKLTGSESFFELIRQTEADIRNVEKHMGFSYNKIIEINNEVNNESHNKELFSTYFSFLDFQVKQTLDDLEDQDGGFEIEDTEIMGSETVNGGFSFVINKENYTDRTRLIANYDRLQYSRKTINYFIDYYIQVLEIGMQNPDAIYNSRFTLTSKDQLAFKALTENSVHEDFRTSKTFLQTFQRQVEQKPDGLAIRFGQQRLTYRELNDHANFWAHRILARNDRPEVIGVHMSRSEKVVIAILAILKSGAAYLPIDVEYPDERVKLILEESGCRFLLVDETAKADELNVDCLEIESGDGYSREEGLIITPSPDQLAYVIFTSGSTGKPKGVSISHENLANYLQWASDTYSKEGSPAFPLFTSVSFDLTVTSLFVPLMNGGTLNIYPELEPQLLLERVIVDDQCDVVKLTPSHLRMVRDIFQSQGIIQSRLKRLIVGGESLNSKLAKDIHDLFGGKVTIYNEYGPTESTVGCMIYEFDPDEVSDTVPIGKSTANNRSYVLDESLNQLPYGAIGELYLSGRSLSPGYLHNTDLTNERFLDSPFREGEKIYKTGDKAIVRPDGQLIFKGRKDDQVKLRGFRIELGEIESVAVSRSDASTAIAQVEQDSNGFDNLVLYMESREALNIDGLKSELSKILPGYMIPDFIISVDSIPHTINGKVDRVQLRAIQKTVEKKEPVKRSADELESWLQEIWCETLSVDAIAVDDNFFESGVGGNSIKLILLYNKISQRFPNAFNVADLFDYPTVADQANFLKEKGLMQTEEEEAFDVLKF